MDRDVVSITSDADGAGTGRSRPLNGLLHSIRLVAHASTPYANTVDITITDDLTGAAILTLTNQSGSGTFYPRAATVDVSNAAALYAAAGQPVNDKIPIMGQVKIVIAQAGDTKSGVFYIHVAD